MVIVYFERGARFMKNFGFTLAEVLITLGIIGVVAALTMPTIIANHQKISLTNSLKANVSILSQAVNKYMYDEGIDDLSMSKLYGTDDEAKAELKNLLTKYLKVVNDCGNRYYVEGGKSCFARYYKTLLTKTQKDYVTGGWSCSVIVNLANGAAICADVDKGDANEDALAIEMDVNGQKGPNQYGRDYFGFKINNKGVVYDYAWKEDQNLSDNSWSGALGKIIEDGWQMKY